MSLALKRRRNGPATREHILEAATQRFCEHSYEDTRLRDIAADVGVDVALVHRAFGSKEQLFNEAMKAAFRPHTLLDAIQTDTAAAVARRAFEPDPGRTAATDPLAMLVRSLSSPQALPLLREFTQADFVAPLAERFAVPGLQRAVLVTACLAGIKIFRDVLALEALADVHRPMVEPMIIAMITAIFDHAPPADMEKRSAPPVGTSDLY